MQVGFYAAAGTLTIDYSTTSDGSSGTVGNSAVLVVCSGGVYSSVDSQSSTSTTGTFIFTLSTAALYIVRFQGTSKINASYVESSFDFSFSANMVIAPAVALWDDSGTTRELEACPKMLLPPLTESTGDWYADCATAATVMASSNDVSNCVGYNEQDLTPFPGTFTATDGGTSLALNYASSLNPFLGAGPCWGSINAASGQTITITLTGDFTGVSADIYDDTGTLVESLPSGAGPLVSSALPYTGRYTIKITLGGGFSSVNGGATITSSGTMSVNQIQALYATTPLLDCPARLNCGSSC